MPAFLRILRGPVVGTRYPLHADRPTIIGRDEGCDVRIDHPSLSRLQCAIEHVEQRWRLSDSKSTNGTRVNGFRIAETVIAPGERIEIGDIHCDLVIEDTAPGSVRVPELRFPLAGRYFGRFELLREVHSGSRGTVYRAREPDRARDVALTILSADWAVDEDAVRRFDRGVRIAAKVAHSGIVQLYSTGALSRRLRPPVKQFGLRPFP